MTQQNQSDAEASLQESPDQESAETKDLPQGALEDSELDEDTKESSLSQEEVTNPSKEEKEQNVNSVPWVDFVPKFAHILPGTLEGKIIEEIANKCEMLRDKELLKLSFLEKKVHRSYYRQWVQQSNLIMKTLVRLRNRNRERELQAKAAAKEKEKKLS